MNSGVWEKPITFETNKLGKYWTVTSAAEAAKERWPGDTGEALEEARRACLPVLEGRTSDATRKDKRRTC